ncbi:MAG: hypothetical protein WD602_03205 [Actinomycetota bacterium]
MANKEELQRVREAKARFGKEFLQNPDVHGVGVGRRRKGGVKTDELAIVVHVQRKEPRSEVAQGRLLPAKVDFVDRQGKRVEVSVDVVEKPIPQPEVSCGDCDADLESRVRPVSGGYSGGPPTTVSNGGTLGGWVWDNVTDQAVVISNDHVFGGTAGTDISQPSPFDGGALPADRIADVIRSGILDVSIAEPANDDILSYEIECGGPGVFEIADAEIDMEVQKTGQTTGLTCGIVELIDYDSDHYGSHNDLWIDGDGNDFSKGGDSGSLYLEKTHPEDRPWRRCVGIHWGGAGDDGVGHPIRAVFDDLNLTTICDGVVSRFLDQFFGRDVEEEAGRLVVEESEPSVTHRIPTSIPSLRLTRAANLPRVIRPRLPRPSHKLHFPRQVEARVAEFKNGRELVAMLREHRVAAVKVLSTADGRRAAAALLKPLAEAITSDDVLEYRITRSDIDNVKRLAEAARRVGGGQELAPVVERAMSLTQKPQEGMTVRELLG